MKYLFNYIFHLLFIYSELDHYSCMKNTFIFTFLYIYFYIYFIYILLYYYIFIYIFFYIKFCIFETMKYLIIFFIYCLSIPNWIIIHARKICLFLHLYIYFFLYKVLYIRNNEIFI